MSRRTNNGTISIDEPAQLMQDNRDPTPATITGREARNEDRENTLRDFMKEVRGGNERIATDTDDATIDERIWRRRDFRRRKVDRTARAWSARARREEL